MNFRAYDTPVLEFVWLANADVIATSGLAVLPKDDEEGFGPLTPI